MNSKHIALGFMKFNFILLKSIQDWIYDINIVAATISEEESLHINVISFAYYSIKANPGSLEKAVNLHTYIAIQQSKVDQSTTMWYYTQHS